MRGWSDPRALPRLAAFPREGRAGAAALSWFHEELSGEGVDADPARETQAARPELRRLLGELSDAVTCRDPGAPFSRALNVPLRMRRHHGESLDHTDPSAVLDGVADPVLTQGWVVRPGRQATLLEFAIDPPAPLAAVGLAAQGLEAAAHRLTLLGLDQRGEWRPLAFGSRTGRRGCETSREYAINPATPPLSRLRLEIVGDAAADRMEIYEVWALPADAAESSR